jgi:RNA polymerase sigma-70 factor, ECF subfamily
MFEENGNAQHMWKAAFGPPRPKLIRVAYRMLGSVVDAEDVVQEAFLRCLRANREEVREPEAWLRRVVTRLSLNYLKSARRRRETYIGPWLPEPMIEPLEDEPDDVTLPLMMVLERLSPLERAAFLLHDVFGVSFDEIAETIDRAPAACRQLAGRARAHVRAARPRFPVPGSAACRLLRRSSRASRSGDTQSLRSLLADNVTAFADGGGKTRATTEPIVGFDEVVRLHESLAALLAQTPSRLLRYGFINGLPGFITVERDDMLQTTALEIENGKIVAIYVVQNPEKLQHLARDAVH